MANFVWAVFWFLAVLCIALPLSLLCAILWVLLAPCTACCRGFSDVLNFLQKGQHFILDWSRNMVSAKNPCD